MSLGTAADCQIEAYVLPQVPQLMKQNLWKSLAGQERPDCLPKRPNDRSRGATGDRK